METSVEKPRTIPLADAGAQLGISLPTAYRLYHQGEFPVPVIRIGRQLRVSQQKIDDLLDGQGAPAA